MPSAHRTLVDLFAGHQWQKNTQAIVTSGTQLPTQRQVFCRVRPGSRWNPCRDEPWPPEVSAAMRDGVDEVVLGTKWLNFWNYAVLPAVSVVALLMTFQLPRLRYEMFPIAILCVAVAFGLRKRQLWAWQWNWVVLVVVCLAMLVPLSIRETHGDFTDSVANALEELLSVGWTQFDDLVGPFAIRLILVSFLWLLPNWLYWKKRKRLFS